MNQNSGLLDPDDLRLSTLLQEMRNEGWATPNYRPFAQAACDGRFPATQRNGRWFGNRKHKLQIAAAMGMQRRPAPEASVISAGRRAPALQPFV